MEEGVPWNPAKKTFFPNAANVGFTRFSFNESGEGGGSHAEYLTCHTARNIFVQAPRKPRLNEDDGWEGGRRKNEEKPVT